MANVIPDLWPDEIAETDVATPLAILRVQAGQLRVKTKGLVEAAVETETIEGEERYHFDLIAPALNRYRFRLLEAVHPVKQVYPVSVFSEQWGERGEGCSSQHELLGVLRGLFQSNATRALIASIVAQSNEARTASAGPPAAKE